MKHGAANVTAPRQRQTTLEDLRRHFDGVVDAAEHVASVLAEPWLHDDDPLAVGDLLHDAFADLVRVAKNARTACPPERYQGTAHWVRLAADEAVGAAETAWRDTKSDHYPPEDWESGVLAGVNECAQFARQAQAEMAGKGERA